MAKHPPETYRTLRDKGLSNRQIATELGVNESTVRRALGKTEPGTPRVRRRVTVFVIEEYLEP